MGVKTSKLEMRVETQARENTGKKMGAQKNIPEDVVFDILSRLPVQSLCRFKCISKSWLSIISHPRFIKTHLDRSLENPDRKRLLLKTRRKRVPFISGFDFLDAFQDSKQLQLVSTNFEAPDQDSESLQCPHGNSDSYLEPMCSCDGLVLVRVSHNSFLLWNPSSRTHRRISCPYKLPPFLLFGLCYDSAADDYRVFVVSQDSETSVVVYCSRNDSWNIFMDNRYVLVASEHRAVANGAIHWVMLPRGLGECVIVYFDLVEKKFNEVPHPSSWKGSAMNLVAFGGRLCLYNDVFVREIEVYAMKEYGLKESWSILFVIRLDKIRYLSKSYVKILGLTKKGQVLLSIAETDLCIYDLKDRTLKRYETGFGRMAISYVETLVSFSGGL